MFYIKIKVFVGAPHEEVERENSNSLRIFVREPAKENLANKRVLEILRNLYPKNRIKIIKGHHSPSKVVEIQ